MSANDRKLTQKNGERPRSTLHKNDRAKFPAGKIVAGRDGGRKEYLEYRPEFAERAKLLCAKGATRVELAEHFDVPPIVILEWRAFHGDFDSACKVDPDVLVARVEESTFERAIGSTRMTEDVRAVRGELVKVRYLKHTPGDVDAQKFVLANRKPKKWSTRPSLKPDDKDNAFGRLYDAICGTKITPNEDQTLYLKNGANWIDPEWDVVDEKQSKKAAPGIPNKDAT